MLVQGRIAEGYRRFGEDTHVAYVLSVASCDGLENLGMTLKAAETFAINLSKYINSEPTFNKKRVSNLVCQRVGFVYAFAKKAEFQKRPVIQTESELESKFLKLQSRLQNFALDLQAFRWRNQPNGIRARDGDDGNDNRRGRGRSKSVAQQTTPRDIAVRSKSVAQQMTPRAVAIMDLDVGDLDYTLLWNRIVCETKRRSV